MSSGTDRRDVGCCREVTSQGHSGESGHGDRESVGVKQLLAIVFCPEPKFCLSLHQTDLLWAPHPGQIAIVETSFS